MSSAASFISRMGEHATHLVRTLHARDPVTNQPAVTWDAVGDFDCGNFDCDDFECADCISIMVKTTSSREMDLPAGRVTEERLRIYTMAEIAHQDRVLYHGKTYEIETAPIEHYLSGSIRYRDATLVKVS